MIHDVLLTYVVLAGGFVLIAGGVVLVALARRLWYGHCHQKVGNEMPRV